MSGLRKVDVIKLVKDLVVPKQWLLRWVDRTVIPTCRRFHVTVKRIELSNSSHKGFHVYIHLQRKIDPRKALELSFALGDDPRRISLNRSRMRAEYNEWSKLFEPFGQRYQTIYERQG
jgi:hypothetical protein